MKKIIFLLVINSWLLFGCQKAEEATIETKSATPAKTIEKAKVETPKVALPIDISKLVNKSADELDKTFGKPEEVKPTDDGGDYRLYQIANQPKGLAVRFYGGKAKSFNVILTKSFSSSREAIKQVFGIEIGTISPIKDPKEPLSEKYRGTFNGVKFSKISAKKDEKGTGFIFVLAEAKE